MTQDSLGQVLRALGEHESGTHRLEKAVEAFQEALQERTPSNDLLDWAETQSGLGTALRLLGERKRDAAIVCEGLDSHLSAWKVFVDTAPFSAAESKDKVVKDLATLKQHFPVTVSATCLSRHEEMLKRMGSTDNVQTNTK
jgi:hypothetical protein